MPRKKILWLCSWYPNKLDHFNGDFIQRQAAAAALYNDIYVIHIVGDVSGNTTGIEKMITNSEGLTEYIVYYKKSSSFPGRLISHYRWLTLSRQAIRLYFEANGMPDLVHIHIPFKSGMLGLWCKKKFGLPYVVTEHWTIYQPQNNVRYGQQKALIRSVLKRVISGCSLVLPVSRDLGLLINKEVTEKSFSVIENVAYEKYFWFAENRNPVSPFRFIHVSNMTYQKNAESIVACFSEILKKYPNTELVIAGAIPDDMNRLVIGTRFEKNILFRGEISNEAVATEMQQANALVLFSRYENSPCAIIEALCCGLPVIATRVGGIPELVNENNGILVDSLDKKALLEALATMINGYEKFDRKKIADDARNRFSYPVIGKKLDEVYSSFYAKKN